LRSVSVGTKIFKRSLSFQKKIETALTIEKNQSSPDFQLSTNDYKPNQCQSMIDLASDNFACTCITRKNAKLNSVFKAHLASKQIVQR